MLALLAPTTGTVVSSRTYAAAVAGGTGAYAHAHGRLTATLVLTRTGSSETGTGRPVTIYRVQLTLRASACAGGAAHGRCRQLSGTLAGQAADDPRTAPIADLPARIRLAGLAGTLRGLGAARAHGEIEGTGFIAKGRRTLHLTLSLAHGSIAVSGSGPLVPGFTAP